MAKKTLIFAHGKESGPRGKKIQVLSGVARQLGYAVESPDFSDLPDPDARVERLIEAARQCSGAIVLTGSSMGGYVVTVASPSVRPAGLFLMAPAFYLPGYGNQDPVPAGCPTVVVHGWQDQIVPPELAIAFARAHGADLHLLNAEHDLVSRLPLVEKLFGEFLGDLGL